MSRKLPFLCPTEVKIGQFYAPKKSKFDIFMAKSCPNSPN
jgi:hypothetical protein